MSLKWKRHDRGYLSDDGRAFLERGARMTHGNNAWLIWFLALPGEVETGEHGSKWVAYGKARAGMQMGTVESLSWLLRTEEEEGSPWFIHTNDAGALEEAKYVAESRLAEWDAEAAS